MVGKDLVEFRRRYGLSQRDLSILMGVAPKTIYSWESGRRSMYPWVTRFIRTIEEKILLERKVLGLDRIRKMLERRAAEAQADNRQTEGRG